VINPTAWERQLGVVMAGGLVNLLLCPAYARITQQPVTFRQEDKAVLWAIPDRWGCRRWTKALTVV